MVLALVAGYARRTIVDSDQFANRATAALRDESVRTVIAERVTDEVVLRRQADLLAARPLIESAVSGIVGGGVFSGLFRTGVRDVHRAVFDRDENTITLTIADVGTVLSAALEKLQPSVARQVRPTDRIEVLERHGRTLGASVADAARVLRVLAIVVPLLCLALAAAALWASPDRRRTVAELGVGAACAGVAVVVLLGIARSVAVREVHGADARAAAGAVWDAFLGDLRSAAWILAACGAIVTAAATSILRPMDVGERLRRLADHVTAEQPTAPRRVLRAVTLIAAGVVALLARDAVVSLVVTLAGVLLIYAGVNALLRLVYRPRIAAGGAPPPDVEGPAAGSRRRRRVVARRRRRARDRRRRRLSRHGRRDHRRAADERVQRPRRAVRPPARPGRARRHAQRDGGPAPRLVRRRAGPADRGPARRRRPRPADRHALRRPPAQRPPADVLRHRRGRAQTGRAGRRRPRGGRRGAAHPRAPRLPRQGHARDVPVPHVLRGRSDLAATRCSATSTRSS